MQLFFFGDVLHAIHRHVHLPSRQYVSDVDLRQLEYRRRSVFSCRQLRRFLLPGSAGGRRGVGERTRPTRCRVGLFDRFHPGWNCRGSGVLVLVAFGGAVTPDAGQVLGHAGGGGMAGVLAAVGSDGLREEGAGGLAVTECMQDEGGSGLGCEGSRSMRPGGRGKVFSELAVEAVPALVMPGAPVGGGEDVKGVKTPLARRSVEVGRAVVGVGGPGYGVGGVAEAKLQFGQEDGGFGVQRVGRRGGGVDASEAGVQELPGA
ncbi:hypothetical protein [Micromonospora globbae]|uniref:hypothetical protein n=1 Tax=Micromonospora globbae TaxID=1894969 RepID=UPI003439DC00